MSYTERISLTKLVPTYSSSVKVVIYDRDWTGGLTQVKGESPVFRLTYNEQPSLVEPFMASALTVFPILDTPALRQLATDVVNSDEDRFIARLFIGLDEVWVGAMVPGVHEYQEGRNVFPFTFACGINRLANRDFDRFEPSFAGGTTLRDRLNYLLGAQSSQVETPVGYEWRRRSITS